MPRNLWWYRAIILVMVLSLVFLIVGCQVVSSGTISGTVTNSLTGKPLAGVTITTEPAIKDITIQTDAKGQYSAKLPIGTYTLTLKKGNFISATQTVLVVAGQTVTKDVALKPAKPVAVDTGKDQESSPGGTVTLKVTVEPLDGSTVTAYKWTQATGVKATIDNPNADTIKVTLGNTAAYKAELIKALKPLERFTVQAVNPHALEAAEVTTFKVTATTSSGSYSATVKVKAKLPYAVNPGIQNMPKGVPVLLHGKTQSTYNWTLTSPTGSKATLDSSSDQNPSFTPDVAGKYTLTEKNSEATIDVYAGTWAGVITGQDDKGRTLAANCTNCHNGKVAADQFTPWKASGHAEIFTQNINNPEGHWSLGCAPCHTVGYDPSANNNGFDEAVAAEGWKVPPHGEVGYWSNMLAKYPKTARLANIQCENCHGPNNDSTLHMNKTIDAARISISSDVCGTCHGEPPRHARFQQWEESGHSNYELAILQATVENRAAVAGHCGRCHSGQGFLAWVKQGDLTKLIQGAKGAATVDELKALGLTKSTVQPQTCVVCHDPHKQGTTSGEPNTATVRIEGNTSLLPAGFQAKNVGKGALCITCHNTRNALHNDANPPTSYSAPHAAAQGDVLLGENAYFISIGQRSPHSYLKDTCVTCHMVETPPPAELSYKLSGTNHSFAASIGVCSSCHSATLDGKAFKASGEEKLHELGEKMSEYLLKKMPAQITIKDYTPHQYGGKSYDLKSDAATVSKDNIAAVEPTEPHGQQGFILKFKTPVTVTYRPAGEAPHSVSLTEAEVQLGDITTDGKTSLIPVSDVLVKVGWNYFLIHGDASGGIHNPAFTNEVLEASITALINALK